MSFFDKSERFFDFIIRELIKDYSERLCKKIDGLKGNRVQVGSEAFVKGKVILSKGSILSQRCFVNGNIVFGKRVYVSPGAVLTGNLFIGDNVYIEVGAVLDRSVPKNTYVFGNPAKFKRINMRLKPKLLSCYSEQHVAKKNEIKEFFRYMVDLGKGSSVGEQVYVEGGAAIKIGRKTHVGDRVIFATSHHVYDDKSHHMLSEERWDDIIVGENVVIGGGSIILGKVKIGNNVIIAPGSVVVSDLGSNSKVSGCPARPNLKIRSGKSIFFPYIANFFAVMGHMFAPVDYFNKLKNISIDYTALINKEMLVVGKFGLKVEKLALIAPRVIFVTESQFSQGMILVSTGAWIGAGSIIMPGLKIGIGAIVGAGAVVFNDVPAWEIWAGNPAKKIGVRDLHENS